MLEEARDTLAAEGSFARKLEGGRARQLEGRRGHVWQLEGGRARQGGRTGVEKSRGVGSRGDGVRRGRPKL